MKNYYIDFYTNQNKTELKKKIFNNINDLYNFCINEKNLNTLIEYNFRIDPVIIHDRKNILNYIEKVITASNEVINYYNNKIDLESLHNKLFNIFNSYKTGVLWLFENNILLKNEALKSE